VAAADVPAKVAAVWRSGFGDRLLAYCREHNLGPTPRPPTVLVQRMVQADVAGVAFGADPVSGRRRLAVVSAVLGLGTALVSGDADADTYHVDGETPSSGVNRRRATHIVRVRAAKALGHLGTRIGRDSPLTDEQVQAVAALVRLLSVGAGRPQDNGRSRPGSALSLFQSRPSTSLTGSPTPTRSSNVWDSSNIAEATTASTTPLTFLLRPPSLRSLCQFCRMLSVRSEFPPCHVFRHTRTDRGRFTAFSARYRLIAMLPGRLTCGFMVGSDGRQEGCPTPDRGRDRSTE
jgi:pyruvate,water dikinase